MGFLIKINIKTKKIIMIAEYTELKDAGFSHIVLQFPKFHYLSENFEQKTIIHKSDPSYIFMRNRKNIIIELFKRGIE